MASASRCIKRSQLVSGTFRFTIDNVSQLVRGSCTLASIGGVEFRCLVMIVDDGPQNSNEKHFENRVKSHLYIAVSANDIQGEFEANVQVTVLNQKDPTLNISAHAENFTFKKDAVLQWPEFAEWEELTGDNNGPGSDSMDIEVSITSVNRGKREKSAATGNDSEERRNRLPLNRGEGETDQVAKAYESIPTATITSYPPIKKSEGAQSILSATITFDSFDPPSVSRSESTSSIFSVTMATSLPLRSESAPSILAATITTDSPARSKSVPSSLPNKQSNAENRVPQLTEGEPSSPESTLTHKEKRVTNKVTQTVNKVAHRLTQTEEDEILSSKIDCSIIAKAFECQVCYAYFQPPINLCFRGHSICGSCRPTLPIQQCPTCEADFPENARNYTLEGIMEFVLYPCPSAGCSVNYTLAVKEKHRFDCEKRKVQCGFPPCTWKSQLDQYLDHVRLVHTTGFGFGGLLCETTFTTYRYQMEKIPSAECFGNSYFAILERNLIQITRAKYSDQFYLCVRLVGTQTKAKQLKCQLVLESQDASIDYRFETTFQLHCDLEKPDQKCIPLQTKDVMRENGLLDVNKNLVIKVRIFKK